MSVFRVLNEGKSVIEAILQNSMPSQVNVRIVAFDKILQREFTCLRALRKRTCHSQNNKSIILRLVFLSSQKTLTAMFFQLKSVK